MDRNEVKAINEAIRDSQIAGLAALEGIIALVEALRDAGTIDNATVANVREHLLVGANHGQPPRFAMGKSGDVCRAISARLGADES